MIPLDVENCEGVASNQIAGRQHDRLISTSQSETRTLPGRDAILLLLFVCGELEGGFQCGERRLPRWLGATPLQRLFSVMSS